MGQAAPRSRPLGFYAFCVAGGVVGLRLLGMLFQSGSATPSMTQGPPVVVAATSAAPVATAAVMPGPARGPTCADLKPNLSIWAGLLPRDVPAEAAPALAHRKRQPIPPTPIVTSAGPLFVLSTPDGLQFSTLDDGRLKAVGTVASPKLGTRQISSNDFEIASSSTEVAAVVQDQRELFFFTIDRVRWAAAPLVKVDAPPQRSAASSRRFHLSAGPDRWGLTFDVDEGFQFIALDRRGAPIGKPHSIKGHTWANPPQLIWNGEGFGVLASRSDDTQGNSLGIWEIVDGKEPVYHPIIDPPRDAGLFAPTHHVSGWLVWEDGRYHFGMHTSRGTEASDALVHFRPGASPQIDDCKLSEP